MHARTVIASLQPYPSITCPPASHGTNSPRDTSIPHNCEWDSMGKYGMILNTMSHKAFQAHIRHSRCHAHSNHAAHAAAACDPGQPT
mmetsp:Transcript_5929/g.15760  ORF Transcript_5929/g.15760 Transcript_5929/m.15760 type:complete len:87 (+) Transcript_5929:510-770(+)